jgi:hypothetical protein
MHGPISKKSNAEPLFVLCPITKSSIVTNIGTDVRSLTKTCHSKDPSPLPSLQENPQVQSKVSEAFAEAAISDEHIRGGFLRVLKYRP